ncbi:hypothetical protein E2C01_061090 [Portunus trituberculatus]|uniref:Uncharacterized protein n=1 Tax=Portunus trituberculatus TaxID=210409 RepID=A0A5B7H779_PORTR|nr:hypothetical protein [Portunus trituberculatus]
MRNVHLHARHYQHCYVFSTEMGVRHPSLCGNSNHSRENEQNTSSGPPNWQRQNARGTSTLRDPEDGLVK